VAGTVTTPKTINTVTTAAQGEPPMPAAAMTTIKTAGQVHGEPLIRSQTARQQ
jgi:hypothetical protein